jgi:hypothetical protein
VDDSVARDGLLGQQLAVAKVADHGRRTERLDLGGLVGGSHKSGDVSTLKTELAEDCGPDVTGGAGQENTHGPIQPRPVSERSARMTKSVTPEQHGRMNLLPQLYDTRGTCEPAS